MMSGYYRALAIAFLFLAVGASPTPAIHAATTVRVVGMPNVRVVSLPLSKPDDVALATLRIAVLALVVGLITLLSIGVQIYLGIKELKTVNAEFAEITRRPILTVGVGLLHLSLGVPTLAAFFNLSNKGGKPPRSIMLELLVPASDIGGVPALAPPFQHTPWRLMA